MIAIVRAHCYHCLDVFFHLPLWAAVVFRPLQTAPAVAAGSISTEPVQIRRKGLFTQRWHALLLAAWDSTILVGPFQLGYSVIPVLRAHSSGNLFLPDVYALSDACVQPWTHSTVQNRNTHGSCIKEVQRKGSSDKFLSLLKGPFTKASPLNFPFLAQTGGCWHPSCRPWALVSHSLWYT